MLVTIYHPSHAIGAAYRLSNVVGRGRNNDNGRLGRAQDRPSCSGLLEAIGTGQVDHGTPGQSLIELLDVIGAPREVRIHPARATGWESPGGGGGGPSEETRKLHIEQPETWKGEERDEKFQATNVTRQRKERRKD